MSLAIPVGAIKEAVVSEHMWWRFDGMFAWNYHEYGMKMGPLHFNKIKHYNDVIMGAIASQISSLMIVYSTVYPDADQRKQQSFASLAFVRGIHRGPVNSRTNGQLRGKCFHLMTSSCITITAHTHTNTHTHPKEQCDYKNKHNIESDMLPSAIILNYEVLIKNTDLPFTE